MENFEVTSTKYGAVRGVHKTSCFDTDYISFQAIPYMKAPLGVLRFRDAQPPKAWDELFNATEDAPSYCAFNMITNVMEGQENAGIINVYTKSLKPQKLYPVMVYIHGGSFSKGNSGTEIYGPDYFMEKDVVLVTFNYRLGAFGFLSLDDVSLGVPGNAGLKDQLFALKWIKENIKNFGGDSENVTLFGESAGGASVHYHSLFEQSRGLFNRAIIMSGTSFSKQWALVPRSHCEKFAQALARKLGWSGSKSDSKGMLEYLENASAFDIVEKSTTVLSNEEEFGERIFLPFAPCIEPYNSDNCLITKDPVVMARTAWSNGIDIMFTGCSFEGIFKAFIKEEVALYYRQSSPAYIIPLNELDLQPTDPTAAEYGERIKSLYYANDQCLDDQESFLKYSSDSIIWHGIYRAAMSRIVHANGKTFLFRFHVNAALNLYKINKKCTQYEGASHVDDLFYLFKSNYADAPARDSKEFNVIQKMIGIFTNFAISGSPNCDDIPIKFVAQKNADKLSCVQITEDDVTEIELPELKNMKVWNSIYEDHDVPLY